MYVLTNEDAWFVYDSAVLAYCTENRSSSKFLSRSTEPQKLRVYQLSDHDESILSLLPDWDTQERLMKVSGGTTFFYQPPPDFKGPKRGAFLLFDDIFSIDIQPALLNILSWFRQDMTEDDYSNLSVHLLAPGHSPLVLTLSRTEFRRFLSDYEATGQWQLLFQWLKSISGTRNQLLNFSLDVLGDMQDQWYLDHIENVAAMVSQINDLLTLPESQIHLDIEVNWLESTLLTSDISDEATTSFLEGADVIEAVIASIEENTSSGSSTQSDNDTNNESDHNESSSSEASASGTVVNTSSSTGNSGDDDPPPPTAEHTYSNNFCELCAGYCRYRNEQSYSAEQSQQLIPAIPEREEKTNRFVALTPVRLPVSLQIGNSLIPQPPVANSWSDAGNIAHETSSFPIHLLPPKTLEQIFNFLSLKDIVRLYHLFPDIRPWAAEYLPKRILKEYCGNSETQQYCWLKIHFPNGVPEEKKEEIQLFLNSHNLPQAIKDFADKSTINALAIFDYLKNNNQLAQPKVLNKLRGPRKDDPTSCLTISSSGQRLFAGDNKGHITIWSPSKPKMPCIKDWKHHSYKVIAISEVLGHIITAGVYREIKILSLDEILSRPGLHPDAGSEPYNSGEFSTTHEIQAMVVWSEARSPELINIAVSQKGGTITLRQLKIQGLNVELTKRLSIGDACKGISLALAGNDRLLSIEMHSEKKEHLLKIWDVSTVLDPECLRVIGKDEGCTFSFVQGMPGYFRAVQSYLGNFEREIGEVTIRNIDPAVTPPDWLLEGKHRKSDTIGCISLPNRSAFCFLFSFSSSFTFTCWMDHYKESRFLIKNKISIKDGELDKTSIKFALPLYGGLVLIVLFNDKMLVVDFLETPAEGDVRESRNIIQEPF
ncbi:hypothetical protein GZ78_09695 [Endozoicomonas numazuensis]|uniref:F-box domain-containing protein n=1 Tax=Endozoicomonas numazuensis TaxID=1137799 RepID=A0A081NHH7_9GAMM|nr:hypothetical protein GZ78_09695 [Endozoicomonas numazuensis]